MGKYILAILGVLFLSFSGFAQSAIKTKVPVIIDAQSQRKDTLVIEIRPGEITTEGQKFLRIDWAASDMKNAIYSKEVFWNNDQINAMNYYLESCNNFAGMSRMESERKRLQLALMITITSTNLLPDGKTYYGLKPSDWELYD